MNRDEFQQNVIEIEDFENLVLRVATGVGKSRIALELFKKFGKDRCVIIIDKNVNAKNWTLEIEKLGLDINQFYILNYKSLHKIESEDFIIFDEAGSLFGEVTFKRYKKLKINRAVFLDATIKDSDIAQLKNVTEIKLNISTAIENNYLPTPKIVIKYIDVEDIKQQFIYKKSRFKKDIVDKEVEYKDWKKIFFSDERVRLHIKCNAKQYLDIINSEIKSYMKKFYIKQFQNMARNLGVTRKRIMGEIKEQTVRELIEKLKKRRKRE